MTTHSGHPPIGVLRLEMKKIQFLLITVLAALLAAACGSTEPEMQDVTIMLDWTPNTNHTGIYVAQAQGLYEAAGLNVEIIIPGETDVHQVVATGSAEFGISYQEGATFARAAEIPVVSVAAIIQHNTSGFASRAEAGINGPADLAGSRYGSFGSPVEYPTLDLLMKCNGDGTADDIQFIDIGWADFLSVTEADEVDFSWIFYAWSGIGAELQGVDLDVIMLKDYAECIPDYYTPILITNETLIAENPDLVKAFVGATSEGYQFAIENPAEAADLLLAANEDLDAELVKASQEWLAAEYQAEAPRWGEQSADIWQNYTNFLAENDIIESFDTRDAFTNEFLP